MIIHIECILVLSVDHREQIYCFLFCIYPVATVPKHIGSDYSVSDGDVTVVLVML